MSIPSSQPHSSRGGPGDIDGPRAIRAVACGLGGLAAGVLLQALVLRVGRPSGSWLLVLALLPLHVAATGAALGGLLWRTPRQWWAVGCGVGALGGRVLRQVSTAILSGFPLVWAVYAISAWLCRRVGLGAGGSSGILEHLAAMASPAGWVAASLVLLLWVPLTEELLFRRLLTDALRWAGVRHATLWSAAAFAAAHGGLAQMPALLVLGVVLQRLRRDPGGLWGPVIAHSAFNGLSLLGWLLLGQP